MTTRMKILSLALISALLPTSNALASRVSCKVPFESSHGHKAAVHHGYDRFDHHDVIHSESDSGDSTIVFETTDLFRNKTFFADSFDIDTAGTYEATVTDFEFPEPLKKSVLFITDGMEWSDTLFGPGSLTFEADPGEYYVSYFALAGTSFGREHGHWHKEHRGGHWGDDHHWEHGSMHMGNYGIEIALVTPASPVPLPAAAWLFGSGLLGLTGVGLRRVGKQAHAA